MIAPGVTPPNSVYQGILRLNVVVASRLELLTWALTCMSDAFTSRLPTWRPSYPIPRCWHDMIGVSCCMFVYMLDLKFNASSYNSIIFSTTPFSNDPQRRSALKSQGWYFVALHTQVSGFERATIGCKTRLPASALQFESCGSALGSFGIGYNISSYQCRRYCCG